MQKNEIENISDTALWVAYYRAMETEKTDPIFKDPYAKILAGNKGKEIVENLPHGKSSAWWLIVRTKVLDNWIMELVSQKKIDTVLNLAAGLDTRPYRLDLPSDLNWIEVDFEPLLSYKKELLKQEKPKCRLEQIVLDLSKVKERENLFKTVAEKSNNILVITEGLLVYLDEAVVVQLAKDLSAQKSFKYWMQDYSTPESLAYVRKHWGKQLKKGNSEMKFGAKGGPDYYKQFGWKVESAKGAFEEAHKLKREMPYASLMRLIATLTGQAGKANKMSGFALLSNTCHLSS